MILQCDQCNTRFRLDDSKLKPGGVKVRCSKCRHVFLAGAEQKQEESEFDAILSGLGAPVPEKREEPAAAADETAFGFDEAPAAPKTEAPVAPGAEAPAASQPEVADFGAFDFSAEAFATPEKPSPEAEEQPDAGEFEFAPEKPIEQQAQAAPVAQGLDYGEFAFEEESPALQEEAEAAPASSFDFGDFSFEEETAAKTEEAPPAPGGSPDFGEFDFDASPVVKPQEPPAAAEALDFGEFSFDEEPAVKTEEAQPAAIDALDFGDFSFAEPAVKDEEPAAAVAASDLGEFSFDEEPPLIKEEPATGAPESFESFSFPEESQPEAQQEQGQTPAPDTDFSLDDFTRDLSGEKTPSAGAEFFGAVPPAVPQDAEPAEEPAAATAKAPAQESPLDFSFGAISAATPQSGEIDEDQELPPLSISSRRKGRSALTVSIVAICVLVIVALSGAGLYLLQSGPAALEKFDQLGIGFVAKWFGMASPEEGRIVIRNPVAAFHQNKEAGELFVVTGEAVNSYRNARASIHVKVSLFDNKGAVLLQKIAYCGNRLSNEQLDTLPMAKIESIMSNQFGDSLSNLGVKPGQPIGFVVAIANVPKEAVDFGVEVVGSTVAGQ